MNGTWWVVMICVCVLASLLLSRFARGMAEELAHPTCIKCDKPCPYCEARRKP